MRMVFWNIRHGGGKRAGKIVEQILEWSPDIVALAEFRGTAPSQSIATRLRNAGYKHQLTTVSVENPTWNALFLASSHALARRQLEGAPDYDLNWLLGSVQSCQELHIGVIHVPLDKYMPDSWLEYRRALLNLARDWTHGPGLFLGDMNSGISGRDEETEYSQGYNNTFMYPLERLGWRDPFRLLHPTDDAPTWISRIGRGFRLDQAFANEELQPHVESCAYDWGSVDERGTISDHAALILDLNLG